MGVQLAVARVGASVDELPVLVRETAWVPVRVAVVAHPIVKGTVEGLLLACVRTHSWECPGVSVMQSAVVVLVVAPVVAVVAADVRVLAVAPSLPGHAAGVADAVDAVQPLTAVVRLHRHALAWSLREKGHIPPVLAAAAGLETVALLCMRDHSCA